MFTVSNSISAPIATQLSTPAIALLQFRPGWHTVQAGVIRQGGQLAIDYALTRLPNCRNTLFGLPAWNIAVNVRFLPGGQVFKGEFLQFDGFVAANIQPFQVTVPVDATEVEIWFQSSDRAGCSEWDSRYGQNYRYAVSPAKTMLDFQAGWQQALTGEIEQGQTLTLEYDPARLPVYRSGRLGMPIWFIDAFAWFHPGQQLDTYKMVGHLPGDDIRDPLVPLPAEVAVPSDATQMELWFKNSDYTGGVDWDSHYGQNYQFNVVRRGVQQIAGYRASEAISSLEMVNLVEAIAVKEDSNPDEQGKVPTTRLTLKAWVNNVAFDKNVVAEVELLDENDALIQSKVYLLDYQGAAAGGGDFFAFNNVLFIGTTTTPQGITPRPDVRKVQYRVYYEVNHLIFTDGILHQHILPADAAI